ncbi:MAG: helix-turn-helix transcriptional regulator [Pleurocapsa sp. SU_196_0]|nr:helix-turn-helix transcriptional regulator [Pleurocapsa sp. SU_196_0]
MPEHINATILEGQPVTHWEANPEDALMFTRWSTLGAQPDVPLEPGEPQRILELELEARLRRLALGLPQAPPSRDGQGSRAAQMARFISQHYLEPIRVSDISERVHLSPNHASGVFKAHFSMTLLEYLTQHRVAHAQRLLATSQTSVLEIALESGFGSSSAFYDAFERACGLRPLEYRRGLRHGLSPHWLVRP